MSAMTWDVSIMVIPYFSRHACITRMVFALFSMSIPSNGSSMSSSLGCKDRLRTRANFLFMPFEYVETL